MCQARATGGFTEILKSSSSAQITGGDTEACRRTKALLAAEPEVPTESQDGTSLCRGFLGCTCHMARPSLPGKHMPEEVDTPSEGTDLPSPRLAEQAPFKARGFPSRQPPLALPPFLHQVRAGASSLQAAGVLMADGLIFVTKQSCLGNSAFALSPASPREWAGGRIFYLNRKLLVTACVAFSKPLCCSVPRFPHLSNGYQNTPLLT